MWSYNNEWDVSERLGAWQNDIINSSLTQSSLPQYYEYVAKTNLCRIWGSHTRGYEDSISWDVNQQVFRRYK
jgi:hypothetical protein